MPAMISKYLRVKHFFIFFILNVKEFIVFNIVMGSGLLKQSLLKAMSVNRDFLTWLSAVLPANQKSGLKLFAN